MFSNLVQRLTEGGFLADGMSRPQGADLDVAGIIGSLPTFRSIDRNRSGGLFGRAVPLISAMLENGTNSDPQNMTGTSGVGDTQRQSRPPSNFLEVLQQSPMFGDAFRGLANGGMPQSRGGMGSGPGLFGDTVISALAARATSNLGAATGQSQGQQQASGTRAPGGRSVGLF